LGYLTHTLINFKHFRKVYIALLLLITIIFIGIAGFIIIEGYTLGEAFYMTVITVSTVGFNEVRPLSDVGRIFTAFLIIFSFSTFVFAVTSISNYILNGEYKIYFRDLRISKKMSKVSNHTIICGYGRNGKQACAELKSHHIAYVVIEEDKELSEELREEHEIPFVQGDATLEKTLERAGIMTAKALITTLPKDADNLFVVLTAREMNPGLLIISRASKENTDKKLKRAGADNVIMPDKIGGAHMASLVIKPNVIEFMDYVMGQGSSSVNLEEISFENLPDDLKNKSIKELGIRDKSGANIVGLRTKDGEYLINPSLDTEITAHTKIFVLGTVDQIAVFRNFATQQAVLKK
jgi:voltage-gated potassium channel|tara:strand:+ start:1470 stop:2522 length:1053 start_codon:yes stop_codon:yes gene_type:complete